MQRPSGRKMASAATWGLDPPVGCGMINSSTSAVGRKYQFLHVFEPTLALLRQLCCQPLHWLEHPSRKHVASLLCDVVKVGLVFVPSETNCGETKRRTTLGGIKCFYLAQNSFLYKLRGSHETIYWRWCNGLRCWLCNHNISWSGPLSSLISCQLSAACHLIKT